MSNMTNQERNIHDSVFRIGIVSSVNGREVRIRMDRNKNSSHLIYKGSLIKNVSVGSYVKILKGFTPIIGKVESESIYENDEQKANVYSAENKIDYFIFGHYHDDVRLTLPSGAEFLILKDWIHSSPYIVFDGTDLKVL